MAGAEYTTAQPYRLETTAFIGAEKIRVRDWPSDVCAGAWVLVGAVTSSAELFQVDAIDPGRREIYLDRPTARLHVAGRMVYVLFGKVLYPRWFGMTGTWADQDGSEIRTACEELRLNGGGTLYLPDDTYGFDLAIHPNVATLGTALAVSETVALEGQSESGVVLRLRPNQAAVGSDRPVFLSNYDRTATETGIEVRRLTIDGNCLNQTHAAMAGIAFMQVRRPILEDVTVINCRAAAPSLSEAFAIELEQCADVKVSRTVTDVMDGGSGSSAVAVVDSFNVQIDSAESRNGVTGTPAFLARDSRQVIYSSCVAQQADDGFWIDGCAGVSLPGCVAGGISHDIQQIDPYGLAEDLGNVTGVRITNSTGVLLPATLVRLNTVGVLVEDSSTGVTLAASLFKDNDTGVQISADTDVDEVQISADCQFNGNSTDIDLVADSLTPTWLGWEEPAIPASNTPLDNPYPCGVMIYIYGGTVSDISVNALPIGLRTVATATPASVWMPRGAAIRMTYTVAPTAWRWIIGV